MIAALIQLLILLLILVVVWYVASLAGAHFHVPAVVMQILGIILALVFLLYALQVLGLTPWAGPPLRR